MVEPDVEPAADDERHRAVASGDDGGDADDERPRQVGAQHRNLGDQHPDEQHDAVARAGIKHQREDDAEARVPRRDRQPFVLVDEADPFERDKGHQEGRSRS